MAKNKRVRVIDSSQFKLKPRKTKRKKGLNKNRKSSNKSRRRKVVKSSRKWVYIVIETKVRELDAKLLLAYYLLKEGYNVVLGHTLTIEKCLEFFPPGIFLDKGVGTKDKIRRFKEAKKYGHAVVNLEEEGFPLSEKNLYIKGYLSHESLKLLDYEFCWGEIQKKVIADRYPQFKNKCVITGNARFDLLKRKYRPMFAEEVTNLKSKHGDFILINTRFPPYTKTINEDGSIDTNRMKRYQMMYGTEKIKEYGDLYRGFIALVRDLSHRYPQYKIIIRPHPSDITDVYRKDLSGLKNVSIIREGNVVNWILASKLVIHNGCTTGAESFLLEKPVISYIPVQTYKSHLPDDLSIKMYNAERVCTFIDHELKTYNFRDNKYRELEKNALLSRYSAGVGNTFAYENIIRNLKTLPVQPSGTNRIHMSPRFKKKLQKELSKKIYKNPLAMEYLPSLTTSEIRHILDKIQSIENDQNDINIRLFKNKICEIRLD